MLCDGGPQVFEAWVTPGLGVTHLLTRGRGQQAWQGHGLPGHRGTEPGLRDAGGECLRCARGNGARLDLGDRPQRADGTGQSQYAWIDVPRVEFASQSHDRRDLGLFVWCPNSGKVSLCPSLAVCTQPPPPAWFLTPSVQTELSGVEGLTGISGLATPSLRLERRLSLELVMLRLRGPRRCGALTVPWRYLRSRAVCSFSQSSAVYMRNAPPNLGLPLRSRVQG